MSPHVTSNLIQPQLAFEEWRAISGYEGVYEVSSHGRVRSIDRVDCANRTRKGCVLSACTSDRYPFVRLCRDRTQRTIRVHELVAVAFLGLRPDGYTVNHIDGVKTNNHVANLEYLTHGDNIRHAVRIGLTGKLEVDQVHQIRMAYSSDPDLPYSVFAEKFNVRIGLIRDIARAKTRSGLPNADGTRALPVSTRAHRPLAGVDVYALHTSGMSLGAIGRLYGADTSAVSRAYHKVADRLGNLSPD